MSIAIALAYAVACIALGAGIGEGLFRLVEYRARRQREGLR
jgi:hypothetical protein